MSDSRRAQLSSLHIGIVHRLITNKVEQEISTKLQALPLFGAVAGILASLLLKERARDADLVATDLEATVS
jgi:hypothetical protein